MTKQRYKELRLLLEREGIRHKEVAEMIGMNTARFSQKINRNRSNFTIDEASAICNVLNISMDDYFFNKNVSKMKQKKKLIRQNVIQHSHRAFMSESRRRYEPHQNTYKVIAKTECCMWVLKEKEEIKCKDYKQLKLKATQN